MGHNKTPVYVVKTTINVYENSIWKVVMPDKEIILDASVQMSITNLVIALFRTAHFKVQ